MGLSASQRARLRALAQEMKEIMGGCLHADGRPMTFAELEDECIEAGDLLTSLALQERVTSRQLAGTCRCPTCDRPGELLPDEEARVLEADRGEVSWLEPEYYCRCCRRSFFPSVG